MRELWIGTLALQTLGMLIILALAYTGTLPIFWYAGPGLDLLGHAALFGTLALLADQALRRRTVAGMRLGPALVLLFAAAEECLQTLSPHRTASPWDLLADVVGVVVLCWLADTVTHRRRTRGRRSRAST
jgi:hypothetical protein